MVFNATFNNISVISSQAQQWNRPNDMFGLHTICFFRQDDGDAGDDDDVSSDDNTDILSSL